MPRLCVVTGSFSKNDKPVEGWVQFTPSRLWVIERGIAWACLAPTVKLEVGGFAAFVTPTDTDPVPWYYIVDTPAGCFKISIPRKGAEYTLRELVEHPPQSG